MSANKKLRGEDRQRCAGCGMFQSVIVGFPRLPGYGICERCARIALRIFERNAFAVAEHREKWGGDDPPPLADPAGASSRSSREGAKR